MLDTNNAHPPSSSWTDKKVERLKEMHAAGKRYPIIGAELGFTRNAIAGKVLRLGLDKRKNAPKHNDGGALARRLNGRNGHTDRAATQRIKKLRVRGPSQGGIVTVESVVREESPQPAEFLGVTFLDLDLDSQCKFPRGEGAAIRFCGQPQMSGEPYCRNCCRIAYNYPLTAASSARAYTADAQRRAFGT